MQATQANTLARLGLAEDRGCVQHTVGAQGGMVWEEEGTQLLTEIRVKNWLFYCLCNSGEADLPWFSSGYSADNIYLTGSGKLTGMVYLVPSIEQTPNRGQCPFFFSPDI